MRRRRCGSWRGTGGFRTPLSPEMRRAAVGAVDAARPVDGSAGRGAGAATEQAARERGWCALAVAADGAGAGAQRGAHDRGDVGLVVATDQASRQGGGRGRQLQRRHGRPRTGTRRGRLHDRRQHREEGWALNQALSEMFRDIDARDVAMVMDADSVIVPEFLETAMGRLEADPDLIAVGGVFYGEGGRGPGRPVAAQRVHPLPARHLPSEGQGLRADRHGVPVPRLRVEGGRRLSRAAPSRRSRPGLRHAGADRGQRDDAVAEVAWARRWSRRCSAGSSPR